MTKKKQKDIEKLVKFYASIKEIAGEIAEMDRRHPTTKRMHKMMQRMVRELDKIAHECLFEAEAIKNEKDNR